MSDTASPSQSSSFQVKSARAAFEEHTDFERERNMGNNPEFDATSFDEARELVLSRMEDR
ncbi:MAG: hypothetical protein ACPGUC_06820 [Gammaproteobacteria bacterium]